MNTQIEPIVANMNTQIEPIVANGATIACELTPAHKSYIQKKEQELGLKCVKFWLFKNRLSEIFLFGKFNDGNGGSDWVPVQIAAFIMGQGFIAPHYFGFKMAHSPW